MAVAARQSLRWVWIAAAVGLLHAGFSVYWAVGGGWLLDTVGEWAVDLRRSSPVAAAAGLGVIALVKAAASVAPVTVAYGRLAPPRLWRALSWVGGVGLALYGGMNTLLSNAVLIGLLGSGDYNRTAMVGHAWLWDPLFLLWGSALLIHLWLSRQEGRTSYSTA
ncbi:DUF3995 domain-containing protein [Sphaerimonospora thailandensis]|uniref:DUF3995 domain-containing protein n=1 Tax=Sphaerimonospora thailandensis TaxID=795644 RepID=UPI001951064F|nr:DUF3995 domain-containing protein [Sphaerimonospora thailandensis]